jgi:pimeloyl-ACP methyl ester carboxylesterase
MLSLPATGPIWRCWYWPVGLLLIVWGVRGGEPKGRLALRWAAALAGVGLAALCLWMAPYPALGTSDIASETSSSGILLNPQGDKPVGVAFIPGALVDPRAYENIWAPIAQAGYPVYIAKPAFGLAFSVPDVIAQASAAAPEVSQWVVAGHSLGGAVASGQTEGAAGLILLGAYPISDISDADVPVLSISATNDGLSKPADIKASKAELPPDAEFVVIDGGVHAYFGDYGPQAGDGQPTITREQQQSQTQSAIESFLAGMAPQAP